MVKLTRTDILKLARLARLKLSDAEIESFQEEIGSILEYVDMLSSVDTGKLLPTYQVTGLTNVTRSDKIYNYGADKEALLRNVPNREGDYIRVKRMIG